MKMLLTGASGFVGGEIARECQRRGIPLLPVFRTLSSAQQNGQDAASAFIADFEGNADWLTALTGVDCVIHCAARVHVMQEKSHDPLALFRKANVENTLNLAKHAAVAGVRRFIFVSSIKVNGEFTEAGRPFTADDAPAAEDPYGVSKHEAETVLHQIAADTGMEVVIIRPPLVYGPGVKGNFESLMRWLAQGIPLPLAAVTDNRRSLVALDNLVDLIITCLSHSAAVNQTFLVSDGEDLSTAELLKRMGAALGSPARLFYLPPALLKLGATGLNKPGIYQRLCGSLQLDIAKTRQLLGWTPPVSVDEGLRRAAKGFRA